MFNQRIKGNDFVYTCEVLPPKDGDYKTLLGRLKKVAYHFDALNIPSCPLGRLRAHALSIGHICQKELKTEAIPHFAARHHTVLSFQSELLGAQVLGIKNILCVTGDRPVEGRGFYELNAVSLLKIAQGLNQGLTEARETIKIPTGFLLCTDYNPNVINVEAENRKALDKFRGGAEVFFTQPVFDGEKFISAINTLKKMVPQAKIIAGLSYLHNKKLAVKLQKFLGIPYDYIANLGIDETQLLIKTAEKIKDRVNGFYIIPVGFYEKAGELIGGLKKLPK